jgi:hypothetical protein
MNHLVSKHLPILLPLFLFGCANYENQPEYEMAVGETVEIYYSTNSCCYYCFENENSLNHLTLVSRETVDPGPSDCEGCNYTVSLKFKAESVGTDTIRLKHLGAMDDCSMDVEPELYMVNVRASSHE